MPSWSAFRCEMSFLTHVCDYTIHGIGKGTLIEMLMKRFPNDQLGFSVSHTTRPPREGEVDGKHYNFTTVEQIKKDIDDGKFIEYAVNNMGRNRHYCPAGVGVLFWLTGLFFGVSLFCFAGSPW